MFIFFKQYTAYEMRISDWSSDVCSSYLFVVLERYGISWTADEQEAYLHLWYVIGAYLGIGGPAVCQQLESCPVAGDFSARGWHEIGRASCRERVCPYV